MDIFGYVYLIRNRVNGKVYIGQTVDTIRGRWVSHKSAARSGTKMSICSAIRKYGQDSFDTVELHRAFSKEELNEMEIRSISTHNSTNKLVGYNSTLGGEGGKWTEDRKVARSLSIRGGNNPHFGKHHTDEMKAKMSADRVGVPSTFERGPEYSAKLSKALTGRIMSREAVEKMRKTKIGVPSKRRGIPQSEQTKLLLSAVHKTRWENSDKIPNAGAFVKGRQAHNKGETNSDEAKEKMKASSKIRWDRHRAGISTEVIVPHAVKPGITGYRGVRPGGRDRFRASIKIKGKLTHLGMFSTAEEAALAYNARATELYGDKAVLNIIKVDKEAEHCALATGDKQA